MSEIPDRVASLYGTLVVSVAALALAGLALRLESLTRVVVVSVLLGPVAAVAVIAAVERKGPMAAFAAGTVVVVAIGVALAL